MLVCISLHHLARETAGAARTRLSLRPLIGEDAKETANPGRKRAAVMCGDSAPDNHHREYGVRARAFARPGLTRVKIVPRVSRMKLQRLRAIPCQKNPHRAV